MVPGEEGWAANLFFFFFLVHTGVPVQRGWLARGCCAFDPQQDERSHSETEHNERQGVVAIWVHTTKRKKRS